MGPPQCSYDLESIFQYIYIHFSKIYHKKDDFYLSIPQDTCKCSLTMTVRYTWPHWSKGSHYMDCLMRAARTGSRYNQWGMNTKTKGQEKLSTFLKWSKTSTKFGCNKTMWTWNDGSPVVTRGTEQVPPFRHLWPIVLQGFLYWQYSPTWSGGQLIKKIAFFNIVLNVSTLWKIHWRN